MLLFRYSGSTLGGKTVSGIVLGSGLGHARQRLVSRGVLCETIQPYFGEVATGFGLIRSRKAITSFSRQLSDLLSGGLLFHDAWKLASSQVKSPSIRKALDSIHHQVESGKPIGEAIESEPGYFDSLSTQMIKVGELSGQLDVALNRIASFREQADEIQSKIRAALWYPSIVLLIAVAVIALLLIYIVPVFEGLYASLGVTLPEHTKFLLNLSTWLQKYWQIQLICAGSVGILLLSILSLESVKVWKERTLLSTPIIGTLMRAIYAARFTRTLGCMLSAGVGLKQAYAMASTATGSITYTSMLLAAQQALESGQSLGKIIKDTQLFPDAVAQFIASGESTGQLDAMLNNVADILERGVKSTLAQLTKLIEPVVIIILGLIVASILVTIYLPMFELVSV